jgi:excisionase family DNA binding protein
MEDLHESDQRRRPRDGVKLQAVEHDALHDLSTGEAAAILSVTERTVRRAIARGELRAIKRGATYRIRGDELERYVSWQAQDASPHPVAKIVSFPPPMETPATLPVALSSFVGRQMDLARVSSLLSDPEVRFVTLTGPGGIGKTRLAIAAADAVRDDFPDGVLFVPLADVSRAERVVPAIADSLGLREVAGHDRPTQLRSFLAGKRRLLVLDNFEQVLEAAPAVAALVAESPQLSVLVTSRARLRVPGERELPVPPLALAGNSASPDDLLASGAGQLFVERAQAHDPAFTVDAASAPIIASICARLDGLPLAIELAAARTKVLTPRQMRERLARSLPILTGGDRTAPARHRTMRDAIAWSYDALTPAEQTLFRLLAVFHGGCTLEAIECVSDAACQVSAASQQDVTLDLVDVLLTQSLLKRETGSDGEPRFHLLETIREYGLERLQPAEGDVFRTAHAAYFLTLAKTLRSPVDTQAMRAPLDQLAADDANLRAALAWLEERGPAADLCAMVATLAIYWFQFSRQHEAASWLERALSKLNEASPGNRGLLLTHYGELLTLQGDPARAEPVYAESVALLRDLADPFDLALTLMSCGASRNYSGKYGEAEAYLEEALAVAKTIPDLTLRAAVAGGVLANLSVTARGQENFSLAASRSEAALRWYNGHAFDLAETRTLMDLAGIAKDQDDHVRVVNLYQTCLSRTGERGDMRVVADALTGIAGAAAACGEPRSALLLFGAADALRERVALGLLAPADLALIERDLAILRQTVGAETAATVLAEGRALPLAAAVGVAGTVNGSSGRQPQPDIGSPSALTRREQEVLELLVEGRTDREIAEVLYMGPRTASWHVQAILDKLGVSTRREVAGRARALGLI